MNKSLAYALVIVAVVSALGAIALSNYTGKVVQCPYTQMR